MTTTTNLSAESLAYFLALASDAGDWGGTPLIGGNVAQGETENGYLTACKKAGLIGTFKSDGQTWAKFTPQGVCLAAEHGIELDA